MCIRDRAAGDAAGSPAGSGGGSVEDEWSRQLDELDRLRPTGGDLATYDGDERLVVDSFTDLPDVVIDDIDDDAASVRQTAAGDQVTSLQLKTYRLQSSCRHADRPTTVLRHGLYFTDFGIQIQIQIYLPAQI